MRRLDDVRLDHQVVVEEVGGIGVVGENAADLGRGEEHHVRLRAPHPGVDLGLVAADRPRCGPRSGSRSPRARAGAPAPSRPCRGGRPPRRACPSSGIAASVIAVALPSARGATARSRSSRTISATRSSKLVSCRQPSFARALAGSPSSGRPRSGGNSADRPRPAAVRSAASMPFSSTPSPRQSIVDADLGESLLDELAHRCASRRSPAHSRRARPAAASATCRST